MDWSEILDYVHRVVLILLMSFLGVAIFDYIIAKTKKIKAETKKIELDNEKSAKILTRKENQRNMRKRLENGE